mgnify:CR=1 FL=1
MKSPELPVFAFGDRNGLIGRLADGAGADAGRDGGKERGPVEADHGPGFAQPGLRDLQILVGRAHFLGQRIELGIAEDLPPPAPRQVIAGLGHLPAIRLLVGVRHGRRRLHVVGADHAAAEQEDGDEREPGETGGSRRSLPRGGRRGGRSGHESRW